MGKFEVTSSCFGVPNQDAFNNKNRIHYSFRGVLENKHLQNMNFLWRIIFIFSVWLFSTIKKNSQIRLIKHKFREKSKNLPKSHKINKCWFLWWFLQQFFDLDPKVSFQSISDFYDNLWGNWIMLNMNDEKINGFFLIEYIIKGTGPSVFFFLVQKDWKKSWVTF